MRAELDARARAQDLAQALHVALRSAAVLDVVDAADRFGVQDGRVRVPHEVGWLHTQPPRPPDLAVRERLQFAQRAEFVDNERAAAQAHFEALLGDEKLSGDATIALAAAWQALRFVDEERTTSLAARVTVAIDGMCPADLATPHNADLVSGAALLAAARRVPWPTSCTALLPALPEAMRGPTFARLDERGVDTRALRAAAAAVERQRGVLRAAQTCLPLMLGADRLATAHDGKLLLWFADGPGSGQGAWTDPLVVQRLVGTAVPDIPGLCFAAPTSDHEVVVSGLAWVAPAPVPPAPWFARPAALIAATLVLLATFAGSLWLSARAVRQQALAMRARSEFLTGVTHELKTPIASIRLVAEVLTDDDVPGPKQRQYFALLAGEAARLSMLIDNVLDLGQLERGERHYDLREGDLADVVRRTVALFAPLAERAGMPVALHEAAVTAPGIVDHGALSQALLAVFENARKYAGRAGHLEVHTRTDDGTFTIAVRDHGPGVPAAEREAIFARFTRGAAQRHGSVPGVGLGLYLARTIVARHGGTLTCTAPEDGAGCVFTFRLPLRHPAP